LYRHHLLPLLFSESDNTYEEFEAIVGKADAEAALGATAESTKV
jgi:hypothetical protein